jgi:hypothetical protein
MIFDDDLLNNIVFYNKIENQNKIMLSVIFYFIYLNYNKKFLHESKYILYHWLFVNFFIENALELTLNHKFLINNQWILRIILNFVFFTNNQRHHLFIKIGIKLLFISVLEK